MTQCDVCGLFGGMHIVGCSNYKAVVDTRSNAEKERDEAIHELTEAIRLTVEYMGVEMLPPIEGWSWYAALVKYAPEKAKPFKELWEKHVEEQRATQARLKERNGPLD